MAMRTMSEYLDFYKQGQENLDSSFANLLERAGMSSGFGKLGITSGYRSPAYNASVGGAGGSYHTKGLAADIDMSGMSVTQRQNLVKSLIDQGAGGLITYSASPNMLHVDMRPQKSGTAHFMHDRSAANISKAPSWFQQLVGYKAGVGGGSPVAQAPPIPADRYDRVTTHHTPGGGSWIGTNNTPAPGKPLEIGIFGVGDAGHNHDHNAAEAVPAGVGASQTVETGESVAPTIQEGVEGGLVGFGDWALGAITDPLFRILFVIIGLIFLIAGLWIISRNPQAVALPTPA